MIFFPSTIKVDKYFIIFFVVIAIKIVLSLLQIGIFKSLHPYVYCKCIEIHLIFYIDLVSHILAEFGYSGSFVDFF